MKTTTLRSLLTAVYSGLDRFLLVCLDPMLSCFHSEARAFLHHEVLEESLRLAAAGDYAFFLGVCRVSGLFVGARCVTAADGQGHLGTKGADPCAQLCPIVT